MKAAICTRYGPPESVEIREVPTPTPKPGEVLINIKAAAVNSGDARIRGFNVPAGMGVMVMLGVGVFRPRAPILGIDCAGIIAAVGEGVTRFGVGDEVFAMPGFGTGTHAEYVTMPESGGIGLKPASLTMAESASLLFGWSTAVSFLKQKAQLQAGERVLVNGASGAVGVASVQFAKHLGAHVTGVCSAANADRVRALGADEVVDHGTADFTALDQRWDIVMDNVGNAPWSRSRGVLRETGRHLGVVSSLPGMLSTAIRPRRGGRRLVSGIASGSPGLMRFLREQADAGAIAPVVDTVYPLDEIVAAHAHVDTGRKVGSVIVAMA